jgi:hypothetical protein
MPQRFCEAFWFFPVRDRFFPRFNPKKGVFLLKKAFFFGYL